MSAPMEIRRQAVEKKNQRKAAGVTALLFILGVIGCFFITAFTISNPPPGEQYVAIGFADLGDVEEASGDVESEVPSETIQEAVQSSESESVSEESPAVDPIATQSASEMAVPTLPEPVEEKPEPVEPERTVSSALSNAFSSLTTSGGGGSQGVSEQGAGNEGNETGKIDGKGLVSGDNGDWALEGGRRIGKPMLDEKPQQEGVIRVNIIVDKSGAVTSATFDRLNSSFAESHHVELAIRAAKTAKFTADQAKPVRRGYLNIRFELE